MKRHSILFVCLIFVFAGCSPKPANDAAATESPSTLQPEIPNTGGSSESVTIEHKVVPVDLPTDKINHAGDQDSSVKADKKQAMGGDRFTFGRFERPFNGYTMDVYYPNIDIEDFNIFIDDAFVYGSVLFKSIDPNSPTPGHYAMEFDLDLDGRGDVLVLAAQPKSTEWTTDGVQVWFDANDDVGGDSVINSDGAAPGDGYEDKVFDQGIGHDPDTAWIRISPDDPNTLQIAVKLSLFNGDKNYLVGFWAGNKILDPALFDINDHFTHEQAGEAMVDFEVYYPVKDVAELDNTCRLSVGFTPNGNEPGMCFVPGVYNGGGPAAPGCTVTCGRCQTLNPATCSCDPTPQCG
jgi:hypothetical protein